MVENFVNYDFLNFRKIPIDLTWEISGARATRFRFFPDMPPHTRGRGPRQVFALKKSGDVNDVVFEQIGLLFLPHVEPMGKRTCTVREIQSFPRGATPLGR